jgi:hypothetical protein
MATDLKTYPEFQDYTHFVQHTQDNLRWAVETWTKTVQDAFSDLPTTFAPVDPYASVDKAFDFSGKVLAFQRDFAKKFLVATTNNGAEVVETVQTAVLKPAARTRKTTK